MSPMCHHFRSRMGMYLSRQQRKKQRKKPDRLVYFFKCRHCTFAKRHSICSNRDWVTSVFRAFLSDITIMILQEDPNSGSKSRNNPAFPTPRIPYPYITYSTLRTFSHFTFLRTFAHPHTHTFKFDRAISSWTFRISHTNGTMPLKRVKKMLFISKIPIKFNKKNILKEHFTEDSKKQKDLEISPAKMKQIFFLISCAISQLKSLFQFSMIILEITEH